MCVSCRGTVRIGGVDVYESNDVWMCRRMLFSIRMCIGKVWRSVWDVFGYGMKCWLQYHDGGIKGSVVVCC